MTATRPPRPPRRPIVPPVIQPIASGPGAIADASTLIAHDLVPFPWDLPPKSSDHVYAPNSIAAPAPGTQAIVTSFQVPDGFQFVLYARLNVFSAPGGSVAWVPGSGDIIWTTDVNTPLSVTSPQGLPVQGLQQEFFNTGSFDHGPVRWFGRTVFKPNDIIRVKVLTTNAIPQGAPNYFTSVLVGWIWPWKDRI